MATPNNNVTRLLNQDLDRLFIELAQGAEENEGVLFSEPQAREAGKRIFERIRGRLSEEICVKWEFCRKRDDPRLADTVTLVTTIGDIVAAALIGIPPFVVATLLVKMGIGKFCKCAGCEETASRGG